MSSTNKTSHYELSQFIGTDKPAWLTDYNGDMLKIDTGLAAAAAEASGAQGTATSAASAAQAAQNTANQAVTSAQANAEDLTELKAALTNTVNTMTNSPNVSNGFNVISYSDYIVTIKCENSFTQKPTSTTVVGDGTRFPIASINSNIFKISASTISDNNSKIYCGPLSFIYTKDDVVTSICTMYAYYDGANTVLYGELITSLFTSITNFNNLYGTLVIMFSGNFISLRNTD